MANPYQPATIESSLPQSGKRVSRHTIAGGWLAGAGLFHFVAINLLSDVRSIWSLDLFPFTLILLGWGVLYRFRVAIALARLIGSSTTIFLFIIAVLFLTGFDDFDGMAYGSVTLANSPWQVGVMLLVVSGTFLPPWWHLQRAIADNHAVHRSTA